MRVLLLLISCLLAVNAVADSRPELLVDNGLRVVMPKEILEIPEIHNQLESGLTTTVLLSYRFTIAGFTTRSTRSIQVQIRFEPWEEVFFLEWIDAQQIHKKQTVKGWSGLMAWWSAQRWLIWQPEAETAGAKASLRLSFELIPFSKADQDQAMRIFVNQSRRVEGPPNQNAANTPSQVVNLLMQTASKSKPTIRFQWTLTRNL